jgi:coenzyme F420-0:L-glutamate ligase / coenzyme F420-1:gamma-L-glutamate ligase
METCREQTRSSFISVFHSDYSDTLNRRLARSYVIVTKVPPQLAIIPISTEPLFKPFSLAIEVWKALGQSGVTLQDKDILVISSKYAAISEGRLTDLSTVEVSGRAKVLAEKFDLQPELAQLVLSESDSILGGVRGFLLASVGGTVAPNAGVDKSNVPKGFAVQYPKKPSETARELRTSLIEMAMKEKSSRLGNLGIILSDSRVTPTRLGTVGIAIAFAGIRSTIDMRGSPDLLGNKLVVTLRAVADQLATAAQLVMGEADESRPIALIRGFNEAFEEPRNETELKTTKDPNQCLILSSLRNQIEI